MIKIKYEELKKLSLFGQGQIDLIVQKDEESGYSIFVIFPSDETGVLVVKNSPDRIRTFKTFSAVELVLKDLDVTSVTVTYR